MLLKVLLNLDPPRVPIPFLSEATNPPKTLVHPLGTAILNAPNDAAALTLSRPRNPSCEHMEQKEKGNRPFLSPTPCPCAGREGCDGQTLLGSLELLLGTGLGVGVGPPVEVTCRPQVVAALVTSRPRVVTKVAVPLDGPVMSRDRVSRARLLQQMLTCPCRPVLSLPPEAAWPRMCRRDRWLQVPPLPLSLVRQVLRLSAAMHGPPLLPCKLSKRFPTPVALRVTGRWVTLPQGPTIPHRNPFVLCLVLNGRALVCETWATTQTVRPLWPALRKVTRLALREAWSLLIMLVTVRRLVLQALRNLPARFSLGTLLSLASRETLLGDLELLLLSPLPVRLRMRPTKERHLVPPKRESGSAPTPAQASTANPTQSPKILSSQGHPSNKGPPGSKNGDRTV